jgi:hypothetical protein
LADNENPRVGGSIPSPGTMKNLKRIRKLAGSPFYLAAGSYGVQNDYEMTTIIPSLILCLTVSNVLTVEKMLLYFEYT